MHTHPLSLSLILTMYIYPPVRVLIFVLGQTETDVETYTPRGIYGRFQTGLGMVVRVGFMNYGAKHDTYEYLATLKRHYGDDVVDVLIRQFERARGKFMLVMRVVAFFGSRHCRRRNSIESILHVCILHQSIYTYTYASKSIRVYVRVL